MKVYLVKMFAFSLMLTIVVELVVVHFFPRTVRWIHRIQEKRKPSSHHGENGSEAVARSTDSMTRLVLLVNVLTNPPAVLLCWLGRMYLPVFMELPVQLVVELLVIAVEASIYCSFAEELQWRRRDRLLLLAVVANVCSWLVGVLLMALL